jgi:nicotinamide-nucleotide amidase
MMRAAEIIAVGSELLLGGRLDTNSLFLTEGLASVGIEVRFKSVVGDEENDIAAAVRTACRRAEVVVLTGGLGPTLDDCTRQAVARATGRPLRRRVEALEGMQQRLAVWGRTPTRAQLRQGFIPAGAEVLHNPIGSAPGFFLKWRGRLIASLPGVPHEAELMFATALAPKLLADSGTQGSGERIDRRVLHTFGLPESELDQRLKGSVHPSSDLRLGLLASPLGVTVLLIAAGVKSGAGQAESTPGGNGQDPTDSLDRLVRLVRRRIGPYIYAEGSETMEAITGRLLAARGLTLAVAESCTGGLIGHRLTQVPGSSAYLDRVAVCYSNRAKTEMLGVPQALIRKHGAVSAEVAAAMARGVRIVSGVGVGLSVTGIAGPGGGSVRKPVGLVYVGLDVLLDLGKGFRRGRTARSAVEEFRFHGTRDVIKWRASQATLNLLRQWLVKTERRDPA